jgi:UDP-2-acetamido-3-amino-2,3-dideoxy-glucuronate N-acetyltransferase
MRERIGVWVHATADVSDSAEIGPGTTVWNQCQIRDHARIGEDCVLGKDVYVDIGVEIGDNVKIQNGALLYRGLTVESGVFIGPGAIFANDKRPRATNPDGSPKGEGDWDVGRIRLLYGSSIGAAAVVIPDVTVGAYALVGAAAVVTRDVPAHALVVGNPARQVGSVCRCGRRLTEEARGHFTCSKCGDRYDFPDARQVPL